MYNVFYVSSTLFITYPELKKVVPCRMILLCVDNHWHKLRFIINFKHRKKLLTLYFWVQGTFNRVNYIQIVKRNEYSKVWLFVSFIELNLPFVISWLISSIYQDLTTVSPTMLENIRGSSLSRSNIPTYK